MLHPGDLLKMCFDDHQRDRKRTYSLGALAKDLKVSVSYTSQVLSRKKLPSREFVDRFASRLKLSREKKSELQYSCFYYALPEGELRVGLDSLMDDLNVGAFLGLERGLPPDGVLQQNWIPVAILEMTKLDSFRSDLSFVSAELGVPAAEVLPFLVHLFKTGLLVVDANGEWKSKLSHVHVASDTEAAANARKFHVSCLKRAIAHIETQTAPADQNRRLLVNLTSSTNAARVAVTRKALLKLVERLNATLDVGEHEELYHLNIQLYPLAAAGVGAEISGEDKL